MSRPANARRSLLRDSNGCVECAKPLPFEDIGRGFLTCMACSGRRRHRGQSHDWLPAEVARLRAELAGGKALFGIARRLGLTYWACRTKARQLGIDPGAGAGGRGTGASAGRWAAVDALSTRCKCGLLLPCAQDHPNIYALATSQAGAGSWIPTDPGENARRRERARVERKRAA